MMKLSEWQRKRIAANKAQKILILGCARSGTSLLASLIGGHPEVGIVGEDMSPMMAWTMLTGKAIIGNKLTVPQQIDLCRRKTPLVKLFKRLGLFQDWPKCPYSIADCLELIPDLKILFCYRNMEDNVTRMMERGANLHFLNFAWNRKLPRQRAEKLYWQASATMSTLLYSATPTCLVEFDDITNPEKSRKQLERCCRFLELDPFIDEMMRGVRWNRIYPQMAHIESSGLQRHSTLKTVSEHERR